MIGFEYIAAFLIDYELFHNISKLSDRNFFEREKATKKLIDMGEKPIVYLNRLIYSDDQELSSRSAKIVEKFIDDIVPFGVDLLPCIDLLPDNYLNRDIIIKKYMSKYWSHANFGYDYTGYRYATKDLVKDLYLIDKVSKKDILKLLTVMLEKERDWWKGVDKTFLIPPRGYDVEKKHE